MRPYTVDARPKERDDYARMPHPSGGRIRFASLLSWLRLLLTIATIVLFVMGLFVAPVYTTASGICLISAIVSFVLYYMFATNLYCKVCANPVLLVTRATKSRKVKKFLDVSYGMAVATPALFKGHFRCMYCGGKVRLKKGG